MGRSNIKWSSGSTYIYCWGGAEWRAKGADSGMRWPVQILTQSLLRGPAAYDFT